MRLIIQAYRTRIVETRIANMGKAVSDPRDAFRSIATLLMEIEKRVFQSQGRRSGGSWKRLTPEWQRRKEEKGLDPRILFASGALFRAMTSYGDENQILEIGPTELRFGASLPYAERLQYGDARMPARPYLKFSDHDRKTIRGILRDHVLGNMKRRLV